MKKIKIVKHYKGKFSFTLCIVFLCLSSFSFAQKQPNVIVIYTDDQGAVDLGCYGAKDIYTPNMDALAKQGTRFTQSYVAAPVCAPSRAAMLTGKYPQNAGVPGNTSARPGSHGLPKEQYTMAELFKDNGYKTGHIGKWHLGMSQESSPNAQGFDYSFGHLRGCIDNYSHYFYWDGPNIHDLHENGKEVFMDGQYFPDLASDKAISFVKKNKKNPFFMYYAINMPHYPYQPTQKWRDYYKDMKKPRGDYAAFISTIDERIGFLLKSLKKLKLLENTIILYQSDNGYSTETRAFNGGGNSGPYRGAKSSLFEGGIRLPTILSWKNNLPKNHVNNEFIVNTDWLPTFASLCNLKNIPNDLDGINQKEMLQSPNTKSKRNSAFWKYGSQWVVRKGKWKLMGYPKDTSHKKEVDYEKDALFLSNLDADVSEMQNLAARNPEVVKELVQEYIQWEHGSINDIPKKAKELKHLGIEKKITATSTIHPRYKNINVLLDGKKGYADFSSGQWIGQEVKNLEFTIDLSKSIDLKEITLGYLHAPSDYIFAPKGFEIEYSENDKDYSPAEKISVSNNTMTRKDLHTDALALKTKHRARYLKIKINGIGTCPKGHSGVGSPAWFFIDEIIIK